MTRPTLFATLLLAMVLVVAACQSSDTPDTAGSTEPAEQPSDAPMEPLPAMVADWNGPFQIDLPNGWTVTHCEGDAPLLCVSDGDRHVGVVELGDHPIESGVPDVEAYLDTQVDEFLASMRDDRAIGCPDLTFEEIPDIAFDVGGVAGVRLGFRMVDADLREVERHVLYWTVQDGTWYWITVAALGDGGCVERLGEFTPEDLGLVHLYVDAIVEQTPLPAPTSGPTGGEVLADGEHLVQIVRMDAPMQVVDVELVEMLTGQEATDAAREDGVIGPDEEVPNDLHLRDGDGTVYSADLEDASVDVIDCTITCVSVEVSRSEFLSGARTALNGPFAVFEVVVTDGRIESLSEVYLP